MKVEELIARFPHGTVFHFYEDSTGEEVKARNCDEIKEWIVNSSFEVIVILLYGNKREVV